jgi:hypothetical protein
VPGGQVFGFEHGGSRRFAELVNRLFQMESGDAPLPPGFILELDRVEWSYLKRELLWTTGPQSIAAAVGNFGRMQINNPTKDALVIITAFVIDNVGANVEVDVSTGGAAIVAGILANTARDMRVPLNSGATLRPVRSTNAVANNLPATSGIVVDRFKSDASGFGISRGGPWILPPGVSAEVTQRVANATAVFLAYGYERPATPDELAL